MPKPTKVRILEYLYTVSSIPRKQLKLAFQDVIECWEDGPVPPIVINSSIWAIVESTAAQMQKDNRFLRNKEIRDTEFLEVSTRIYNELLGFASEKFDILNIKEFV